MTTRRLPHVGLNIQERGSFYTTEPSPFLRKRPMREPERREPIRVQATVGEPIREIEMDGELG